MPDNTATDRFEVCQLANNIWTIDGPDVVFAGAAMNTRMTMVRLSSGDLWVHSPICWSARAASFVESLGGDVRALVAPNKFHYLYLAQWQAQFPAARTFADAHLIKKVTALADAELLTNQADALYADDVDQVVFGGNRLFQEVVFFHKPSRTLILTDLIINLPVDGLGWLPRLFLRFEQVTYPNGGVPRLTRWFTWDKTAARAALGQIQRWEPTHLTFCHGPSFEASAQSVLQRAFAYLS